MKNLPFILLVSILFSAFISGYSQSLTDSLKAHYQFENNFNDNSGKSNHLLLNSGTVTFVQRQQNNMVASFNGISSLRTNNQFNNSNYTQCSISFWIKTNTAKVSRQIIIQGAFLGFGELIQPSTNKIQGWFDNSAAGAITGLGSITDGLWHHITHQTNGTFTDLFIDGVLNARVTESLVTGNGNSNEYIYIGSSNTGAERLTGQIDDIRIYNRILTLAEITTLSQPITTSIKKHTNSNINLNVFPNPTNGEINIVLNNDQIGSNLSIKNILGKSVYNETLTNSGKLTIEFSGDSGIYFIELVDNNGNRSVSKIIKH